MFWFKNWPTFHPPIHCVLSDWSDEGIIFAAGWCLGEDFFASVYGLTTHTSTPPIIHCSAVIPFLAKSILESLNASAKVDSLKERWVSVLRSSNYLYLYISISMLYWFCTTEVWLILAVLYCKFIFNHGHFENLAYKYPTPCCELPFIPFPFPYLNPLFEIPLFSLFSLFHYSADMNSIKSLRPGREAWRIRARVIRKWEMAPTSEPSKPYALQLVLIDSEVISLFAIKLMMFC